MKQAVVRLDERRERAQAAAAGQRHDLYSSIHKGIRAFIGATLDAAGRMDALDPEDVAATGAQVRSLLAFLRLHLHLENQFVHPALEARRAGTARQTAHDHVEHEHAIERLEALLRALERAEGEARPRAAFALYRALAVFAAENYLHMEVEEADNNSQLWSVYSDDELAQIHAALLAAVPPEGKAIAARWMLPALTPAERAGVLTEMQHTLPPQAFATILAVVQPHLSDRDRAKLSAALGPVASSN